jgi:hypothetical protein
MFVSGIDYASVSTMFLLDFVTVLSVWYSNKPQTTTTQKPTNGTDRRNARETSFSYRVPPELSCEC